eukprot:8605121-Alexandrium_andersonii.AAC.3
MGGHAKIWNHKTRTSVTPRRSLGKSELRRCSDMSPCGQPKRTGTACRTMGTSGARHAWHPE